MTAIKPCKGSGQGEHKFTKFDDVSVVCERCAERRVIAEAAAPTYVPYPYIPYVPQYPSWWYPSQPWPQITVWSDVGTRTIVSGRDTGFVFSSYPEGSSYSLTDGRDA